MSTNVEQFILCEECDGMGFIEDDGRQRSCPVCDGDPKITFATVKDYAQQIDALLAKSSAVEELVRVATSFVNEAERVYCDGCGKENIDGHITHESYCEVGKISSALAALEKEKQHGR